MSKWWTDKETEYLRESWGTVDISRIAKKLNRTEIAILRKAERLKLGAFLNSGEYITFNQLLKALHLDQRNTSEKIAWVKNRNFPVKKKKVVNAYFNIVYLDDFWKWAEHNQDMLDFSKLDELVLGKEPEWVKCKRNSDAIRTNTIRTSLWTEYEDNKLINLLKTYRYSYKDLSKILGRTEDAIKTRILKLRLKYRPLKMDNHTKWTEEEINILISALHTESNYEAIGHKLPRRSVKAIKSRVALMYGTCKLNEVKNILE